MLPSDEESGHGEVLANVAVLRDRLRTASAGGANDGVKRLELKDLGRIPSAFFERGVPGMYRELAP